MQQQTPYIDLLWRDGSESPGSTRCCIRTDATRDMAAAAIVQLAAAARMLSDARIIGAISKWPGVVSPRPLATSSAVADAAALLIFSTGFLGELAAITIPGLKAEMLTSIGVGAGRLIDTDHPAVVALVDALTSAPYVSPFGYSLLALESAYLQAIP